VARARDTVEVNRQIHPRTIAEPAANYAHAVITEGPTRWLHTSGVVPTRPDGSVPDGVAAQAAVVWENLAVIVTDAGMTMSDVVSVVTYVVEGNDLAVVVGHDDRHRPVGSDRHRAADRERLVEGHAPEPTPTARAPVW